MDDVKQPIDSLNEYGSNLEHTESLSLKDVDQIIDNGNEAVLFDIGEAGISSDGTRLKLASDGHTVLIPQPTHNPSDPLNWSALKKHLILANLALNCFVMEFSAGVGAPAVLLQAKEWGLSPTHVVQANNLLVAMMGLGSLIWIPTSYYWGRAPLLFWTNTIGTLFLLGSALSTDFQVYYAFRALQGLFLTCGQSMGVALVKDMFFLHEQARKIGIFMTVVLISPSLGPQWANWMVAGLNEWRAAFWLSFAISAFTSILMLLTHDETFFRRDVDRSEGAAHDQLSSRLARVVGLSQVQTSQRRYFLPAKQAYGRLVTTFLKPVVVMTMIAAGLVHMWAVGIVLSSSILFGTPVDQGGYGYNASGVAILFFIPIVGLALGEVFGHFFNDWRARYYVKRHKGIFKPEATLVTGYVAGAVAIPMLILLGCTLEFQLNVVGIVLGWGGYLWAVIVWAVTTTAYLADAYPLATAEISGLLTFARTIFGFGVSYFQAPWGDRVGFLTVFGVEAAICSVGIMILIFLHCLGGTIRAASGPLNF